MSINLLKFITMNEATLNKMAKMKLYGMQNSFRTLIETNKSDSLTNDQLVGMLIDSEWEDRENRKINRNLKNAKFRYHADIEQIDFGLDRNLDKTQILRLADCSFIEKKQDVIITGPTGAGKSYLATAIGRQACLKGLKTLYYNTQKLFPRLKMLKADGTYIKEINKISRFDLLILDDFGLQKFDSYSRMALLEIIEDRHKEKSTIIASQLPVQNWHEIIGESSIADAVLDRIVHTAHRIEIKGESMRKKNKQENKSQ